MCGTLDYLPPEMVAIHSEIEYDHSIDIWSIGVLAYELCVGSPPFESASGQETKNRIKRGQFSFPDHCSDKLQNFVRGCLQSSSRERMTLKEVLAHPWTQHVEPLDV